MAGTTITSTNNRTMIFRMRFLQFVYLLTWNQREHNC